MRILTVVGARPQFIKAATVSRVIADSEDITEILVHTGQHYDKNMSDVFFSEMQIPKPNYNLNISGLNHGAMVGRQLEGIENLLLKENPDWVLVYGDTNSTLAGALAAAKIHIPVCHVEAGLRSFNRAMPEEINRILTDHLSELLLAPTELALSNLEKEGIASSKIDIVGDVMLDASLFYRKNAKRPDWFDDLNIDLGDFVLATIHRAENTEKPDRLISIFKGLELSKENIILPLHPRTKAYLDKYNISPSKNIHIVNSVSYLEMVWLEDNCKLICTDSGGVQKEAYFFNKPCVTLRDETEWVELVDNNWNCLVGANSEKIANEIKNFKIPENSIKLYGNGDSAEIVVGKIKNYDIQHERPSSI